MSGDAKPRPSLGVAGSRRQTVDWLSAGLEILSDRGEQALTIDELCGLLKRTKGSFYHHFSGREDYCHRLLAFIEESDTSDVIRRAEAAGPDPHRRILALIGRTGRLKKDFEPALRAWALRDDLARQAQERIDRQRIEYLERLCIESGLPPSLARLQAQRIYAVYLGASLMCPPLKGARLRDLYRGLTVQPD